MFLINVSSSEQVTGMNFEEWWEGAITELESAPERAKVELQESFSCSGFQVLYAHLPLNLV